MGFDFPNAPTQGQLFQPPGGPNYVYSNGVWTASTGQRAMISDTPPSGAVAGDLWWESDSGNLYVYYNDGDSSQWVQCNTPGLNQPVKTAEEYNRIVNGAMQHSQENGNTLGTTDNYFSADQWSLRFAGLTGISIQRALGANNQYQIYLSCNTAKPSLAAGDTLYFEHKIEGARIADLAWGTAGAMQAVLRFEVYVTLAGTYSVAIRNVPATQSWLATFTVSTINQWTPVTLTVPGATAGTWTTDSSAGLNLTFGFAIGSTFLGAAGWSAGNFLGVTGMTNGVATATQTFYLRRVGLYADPNATGVAPPWVTPDYASELAACQRYWQQSYNIFAGSVTSGSAYYLGYPLRPSLRISPALSGVISGGVVGFPNAVGSLSISSSALSAVETRTANATSVGGTFASTITANARL
jgi:hypothetical protein